MSKNTYGLNIGEAPVSFYDAGELYLLTTSGVYLVRGTELHPCSIVKETPKKKAKK